MSTAPLTVHNASITTATVSINTLTTSGKQVALAVEVRYECPDQSTVRCCRPVIDRPWSRMSAGKRTSRTT